MFGARGEGSVQVSDAVCAVSPEYPLWSGQGLRDANELLLDFVYLFRATVCLFLASNPASSEQPHLFRTLICPRA